MRKHVDFVLATGFVVMCAAILVAAALGAALFVIAFVMS